MTTALVSGTGDMGCGPAASPDCRCVPSMGIVPQLMPETMYVPLQLSKGGHSQVKSKKKSESKVSLFCFSNLRHLK